MLRGLFVVKQPTVLDGLAFDPFSFQQDGLTAPEVNVGRGEIVDALVTAPVVVVRDEYIDLSFEIAGQIIVLEQDAVLECPPSALVGQIRQIEEGSVSGSS